MNKLVLVFALFFSIAISAQPIEPQRQNRQPLTRPEPERAAKAQELLAQARAAIGRSAKLDDVKTLAVSGKVHRVRYFAARGRNGGGVFMMGNGVDLDPTILGTPDQGEEIIKGNVEYQFAAPDKFRWEDETFLPSTLGFLNGDQFWQKPHPNQPAMPPQFFKARQKYAQASYAYITTAFLLAPPPGFAVEYSYTGEKPFRQTVADVITITGAERFQTELYLDQKTHLPLLLRSVIGAIARPALAVLPSGSSQAVGYATLDEARQQAEAKPPGQQEREKLILFEDYRAVNGVLFPHRIITQINGKIVVEEVFTKIKVNQPIKPEIFTEKQ